MILTAALAVVVEDTYAIAHPVKGGPLPSPPPPDQSDQSVPTGSLQDLAAEIAQIAANTNVNPILPKHKPARPQPGQGCTLRYPYDSNIPSGQFVSNPDAELSELNEPPERQDPPEVPTRSDVNLINTLDIIGNNPYTPTGRLPKATVEIIEAEGRLP